MEVVVLAGELPPDLVLERMDGIYEEVYGRSLEQGFGPDWSEFYPFPQIPFAGGGGSHRAGVARVRSVSPART